MPTPATNDDRARLRRELRARRRALEPYEVLAASEELARHLAALPLLARACRVAVYVANDGEIDPAPLVRRLWDAGRATYLPVLCDRPRRHLRFAPLTPETRLLANRFGIPEPDVPRRTLLPARALDVVVLPLVAFDAAGNRLGMGGGYYDRTLAHLRRRTAWKRPRAVGVGYAWQRVARLPAAPWDVPLACVVTDTGVVGDAR